MLVSQQDCAVETFSRIFLDCTVTLDEEDDAKWWTASFLDDLGDGLAAAAEKLKKVAEKMEKAKVPKIRVNAATAFTIHAQSVIRAAGKAESGATNQTQSTKHKKAQEWERNRRTVLQRNAKKKAVFLAEALQLVGDGNALTLRQLSALLRVAQMRKPNDAIPPLLEEIRASGIEDEPAIESPDLARMLEKGEVASAKKPTKKASKKSSKRSEST